MIGSLVACAPLGLLPPDDPWVAGTLDVVRERFCLGDAFYDAARPHRARPVATLQIARCELEAGDPQGLAAAAVDARRRHPHVHLARGRSIPGSVAAAWETGTTAVRPPPS